MSDIDRNLRRPTLALLLAAIAGVALAGCSSIPFTVVDNNPADGVDSGIFTIAVGDCLNDGGAEGEISSVPKIDCSEPHDSEVYASVIMDDGVFPGQDAIFAEADRDCEAEFDAFVGINYAESIFSFSYFFPTDESWADGDREIVCLIFDPAGKITSGSLAGAAR